MTSAVVEIKKNDTLRAPLDKRSDMAEILARMKAAARVTNPPSYEERVQRLEKLEATLLKRKGAIADAVHKDFGGRSRHESLLAEVYVTVAALRHARSVHRPEHGLPPTELPAGV